MSTARDSIIKRIKEQFDIDILPSELDKLAEGTMMLESSGGKNKINPKSSATGRYQFLTKGDDNATYTAVNRLKVNYERMGKELPSWAQTLKNTKPGDKLRTAVLKLTEPQERELFFANIDGSSGSDKILTKLDRQNPQALVNLYTKKHHTQPTNKLIKAAENVFYPKVEEPTLARKEEPKEIEVEVSEAKPAETFKQAFAAARGSREGEFTYDGKRYNTRLKGETPQQYAAFLGKEMPVRVARKGGMVIKNYKERT